MRRAATPTLDALVREALEGVVRRTAAAVAQAVADLAAEKLEADLEVAVTKAVRGAGRRRSRRPAGDLSRWTADRRARRVPNFVIDLTGLKTKRQIVAKYGDGVVFEKGKPAPKAKAAS